MQVEDADDGTRMTDQQLRDESATFIVAGHEINEPETFQPERWDNDLEKQLPRGIYFPFNDGPRVCIGKSFSIMEALLLLATISQQFQLDLVPNQIIEPRTSIALKPKDGVQVVLKANS
ncbi:MAG: cytochrome P450 [Cyanobacteria bacterium P01_A01_bin.17]